MDPTCPEQQKGFCIKSQGENEILDVSLCSPGQELSPIWTSVPPPPAPPLVNAYLVSKALLQLWDIMGYRVSRAHSAC